MLHIQETESGRSFKISDSREQCADTTLDFIGSSRGGTLTTEALMLVLIMRLKSLDREEHCDENDQAIELLTRSIEVLIQRAKKRGESAVQPLGIAEASAAPSTDIEAVSSAGVKMYAARVRDPGDDADATLGFNIDGSVDNRQWAGNSPEITEGFMKKWLAGVEVAGHPNQDFVIEDDVLRFKKNQIVRDVLDYSTRCGFGLSEIAAKQYGNADMSQLFQLIGYSVSTWGGLTFAVGVAKADLEASEFLKHGTKTIRGPASVVGWLNQSSPKVQQIETPKALDPLVSHLTAQLQRVRLLLVDVHAKCDAESKKLIEERTGNWFVWGVDRDAVSKHNPTEAPTGATTTP